MSTMIDLQSAESFVMKRGTIEERARLQHILTGEAPSRVVIEALLVGQRADGGWPAFWATDYSSLDATCFRLSQAEQIGLRDSDFRISQALGFLSSRQNPDGSFEEDSKFRDSAPPWAKPGEEPARLYVTALCGFWLVVLGKSKAEASLASEYLQKSLGAEGLLPTFPHGHWLAGGLWHLLGLKDSADRTFAYLLERLDRLHPSSLGWLINTLYLAGVPVNHPLVAGAAGSLEKHQREDGSWEAEDGPEFGVNATIEAVRALKVCRRFQ
jgi:hypothetical protein